MADVLAAGRPVRLACPRTRRRRCCGMVMPGWGARRCRRPRWCRQVCTQPGHAGALRGPAAARRRRGEAISTTFAGRTGRALTARSCQAARRVASIRRATAFRCSAVAGARDPDHRRTGADAPSTGFPRLRSHLAGRSSATRFTCHTSFGTKPALISVSPEPTPTQFAP